MVRASFPKSPISEGESVDRSSFLGVVEELRPAPNAVDVFKQLAGLPHCIFLDSARRDPTLGRYSFITAGPFDFIKVSADQDQVDSFATLTRRLGEFASQAI